MNDPVECWAARLYSDARLIVYRLGVSSKLTGLQLTFWETQKTIANEGSWASASFAIGASCLALSPKHHK